MLKHLLPITDEMFGIEHRQLDIVFAEQIQQRLLALDLRQLAKVAVAPEKVECVVDEAALPACSQLCLKFGEVGPAIMDDNHLAIDDSFAGDGQCPHNLGEPIGPVLPVAGVDLLPSSIQVYLNAVAIVLDFMKPQVALGCPGPQCGKVGFNEPRHLDTL